MLRICRGLRGDTKNGTRKGVCRLAFCGFLEVCPRGVHHEDQSRMSLRTDKRSNPMHEMRSGMTPDRTTEAYLYHLRTAPNSSRRTDGLQMGHAHRQNCDRVNDPGARRRILSAKLRRKVRPKWTDSNAQKSLQPSESRQRPPMSDEKLCSSESSKLSDLRN